MGWAIAEGKISLAVVIGGAGEIMGRGTVMMSLTRLGLLLCINADYHSDRKMYDCSAFLQIQSII